MKEQFPHCLFIYTDRVSRQNAKVGAYYVEEFEKFAGLSCCLTYF